jgi:hypothetical protein
MKQGYCVINRESIPSELLIEGGKHIMETFNNFVILSKPNLLLASNKSNCDTNIAQHIHGLSLLFSLTEEALLSNVIKAVRRVESKYIPTSNKAVSEVLLDDHYKRAKEKNA